MKVLIVGRTAGHAVERLAKECDARGHTLDLLPVSDLVVDVSENSVQLVNKQGDDLMGYDVYHFRGMGSQARALAVVARFLHANGKCVIERSFAERGVYADHFTPTVISSDVPAVDYQLVFSEPQLMEGTYEYPVVVKGFDGSQGMTVFLVQSADELRSHAKSVGYPLIVQTFVPMEADYRVVVVNGSPYGAVKRYKSEKNDFYTTRFRGKREAVELPKEAVDLALRATEASKLDIAGVDLVLHDGVWKRLEVNMSPQFKVHEKITGLNIAGAIVSLFEERHATHT